jgi:hypothetical protein
MFQHRFFSGLAIHCLKFPVLTGIFIALIFTISCKKEDTVGPVIKINKPSSGQHFTVGDTIFVSANISDNEQISSVTVKLLSSNYISVGHDISVKVPSNNSLINVHYIIEDLNLLSGNYIMAVVASDGHNSTNAYVTIHLTELPRVRKAVYLLTATNNSSFRVSALDSMHTLSQVINVNGDYSGSAIYSIQHQLYTLGSITGALNSFDLELYTSLWTHPPVSPVVPTFRNLFFSGDIVYVSYYDGNILGFDQSGNQNYSVDQQG